jgi:vacuolar-type H+-ATPase subunit F/Vma7
MTTSQEITIRLKIQKLEYVLDLLCQEADRPITVFLPEKHEDQVSYLKKEITRTVEMI